MEPLDQEAGGRPEWIFVVSSQLLLGKKRGTDQGEARSSGLDTWVGLVPSTDTLPDRPQNQIWLSSLVRVQELKGGDSQPLSITRSEKFIRERN